MSDLVLSIDYGLSGVQLTEVLRVDDDARDLLPFFNSIRNGDVAAAVEAIERGVAGLEHVQPNVLRDSGLLEAVFQRAENLRDAGHRGASAREFRPILESTMVLTAQHNGSLSRNEWKDSVAKHLGWDLLPSPSQIGLPVLITRTDHANGLTNGDTGLIVTLGDGETAVYQPTNDASDGSGNEIVTTLPPASIHDWQPWWAMTIHKSQGSEFSHVIVSITPGTRLLSRELLYTAVTRAKKRVSIVCDIEDFKLAINKPATRFSGLAEIIAQLVSATALP
jgi:exodeoxyribonuclease V alpha subunit